MSIVIPKRLEDRISENKSIASRLTQFHESIGALLRARPDFFPDYTEHGIPHVEKVLQLADRLIPDDVLRSLRPEDVSHLVCAATIHDLGMFLSVDGVLELLEGSWADDMTEALDKHTWADEWDLFRSEVRRFSDEKMLRCFDEIIDISDVCTDIRRMQRRDYLIVGEFLRRHHPRLAHEIACKGFPGSATGVLFGEPFEEDDRDLIGLLARSHGMALRDTENYLAGRFSDELMPGGCPVFYLMAVLRLADLLDAGKHRAPQILLDRQAIYIPVSNQEWCWNQKLNISRYSWSADRDSLSIDANPTCSTEYMLLKDWMEYVQRELDMSWTVLCEKYRMDYRLSIHRIKSTILDPDSTKHRGKFLPREAKLRANPELLKQLVAPLYGDDVSCGVRELLQNAVDACIEREHLAKKKGRSYRGHVRIRLDTKKKTLTVEDDGIGMDEDVLLNYYLSAGSSYRYSDGWARDFAPDKTPQIARSGKFGVGVLAAFLLGERVAVSTRHLRDTQGYAFEFGVEPKQLDIARVKRDVGTTVTVHLTSDVLEWLRKKSDNWCRWYVFDDPDVQYFIDGINQKSPAGRIPRHPDESCKWLKMESAQYDHYLWTYTETAHVYCNGILIPQRNRDQITLTQYGLGLPFPSISVLDPASQLKIDLSRNMLLEIPAREELIGDIFRYHLAKLLMTRWDSADAISSNYQKGLQIPTHPFIPFLHKSGCFLPNLEAFLAVSGVRRHVVLCCRDSRQQLRNLLAPDFLPADMPFVITSSHRASFSYQSYFPLTGYLVGSGLGQDNPSHYSLGVNLWLPAHTYSNLRNITDADAIIKFLSERCPSSKAAVSKVSLLHAPLDSLWWKSVLLKEIGHSSFGFLPFGEEPPHSEATSKLREKYADYKMPIDESKFDPSEWMFALDCAVVDRYLPGECLMTELIREYLGSDIWIPYDMEARKKKFPKAFRELKYYIDRIEKGR